MSNWAKKAVFYHIYPLGFCGAPFENPYDTQITHRIQKVKDWIPHLKRLGISAIYFSPIFESKTHGYDTTDYTRIDSRLGSNEDFAQLCTALHEADIKVVLDGVFSHVGRDFFAFKELQQQGSQSKYKDWFQNVSFNGRSPFGDPFYYDAWEGHFELVKLNLWNPEVKAYLFEAIGGWIKTFDIDGIRLDVAYCLEEGFLRELRQFVDSKKQDFWLMGEMIHGDYKRLVKPDMLDSATNYECYKGIYSSHNDKNYFEINHSLNRLFGQGGLYQGLDLYNFVDNHDVTRISSILKEKKQIKNVYTLLFAMPGIPSVYYGSEWQVEGNKNQQSDQCLRPCLELTEMEKKDQGLVSYINELATIRKCYKAFSEGSYEQVIVKNEQLVFARVSKDTKAYCALNLAEYEVSLRIKGKANEELVNVLGEREVIVFDGNDYVITLPPFSGKLIVSKGDLLEPMARIEEGVNKNLESSVSQIKNKVFHKESLKEKVIKKLFNKKISKEGVGVYDGDNL